MMQKNIDANNLIHNSIEKCWVLKLTQDIIKNAYYKPINLIIWKKHGWLFFTLWQVNHI